PKQQQHPQQLLLAEHDHLHSTLKTLQIETLADLVPQPLQVTLETTKIRNRTTATMLRTRNPTTINPTAKTPGRSRY
ncbi:hypothetical protein QOZ75_29545, partial [Pseudomonas aeruginosa]|uniref:hypothetical protein n=1 Tax=Pseudomonas aeruginosa TaxID=287 RepID=UPI0034580FD1